MKIVHILIIGAICFASCKKDDSSSDITLLDGPPLSFDLLEVPNGGTEAELTPTLSWESAKNPRGGVVTYDLYLDDNVNPTTLIMGGIGNTSFELIENLQLLTDYHWKVVAKDANGKISQSPIHKFTTRYYRFSDAPVAASTDFSPRYGLTSSVFDDKMWVFGGREIGMASKNDVWYSNNGIDWTKVTQVTSFTEAWGHSTVVFDDKLWAIAGTKVGGFTINSKSEIWYSSDGANWTAATLDGPFSKRLGHTTIIFDDKMWVIGGSGFLSNSDVWNSSDGIEWTEVTSTAAFSNRIWHSSVVFKDKMWVIGGSSKNDVWYSSDGVNWTEATAAAPFSRRRGHTSVVFDNKIWVIGGQGVVDTDVSNDVWYSSDGINWTEATTDSFSGRWGHTSVVFDNTIWVIGGWDENGQKNDVWALD